MFFRFFIFYFIHLYIEFRTNDSEDNSAVKSKLNNMKNQQAISSADLYGGDDYGN